MENTTYRIQKYKIQVVKESNYIIDRNKIQTKKDVIGFTKHILSNLPLEYVCIIALDSGHRIIGYILIEGEVNQCQLSPQTVFRFLLSCGAVSFIIAHNHPGGNITYSSADERITKVLYETGQLLSLYLLDHLIICDDEVISLKDSFSWFKSY